MDETNKIKTRQIIVLVGGIVVFILLIVIGLWASDPNRGKPTPLELQRAKAAEVVKDYRTNPSVSAEERWIAQSEKDFSTVKKTNKDLAKQVALLEKKLDMLEKKQVSNVFDASSALPKVNNISLPPPPREDFKHQMIANTLPPPPSGLPSSDINKSSKSTPLDTIQFISLNDDSEKDGYKNISHYIPQGSFATSVLMSGLDAPTGGLAQKQPMPVLLRLKDDGQLPNYFKSEVSDCHIVGAGYGDIASERAYIRLESISCVLVNGDVIEATKIQGYVAGEDGKAGLRGRLVSKQGSMIAKAALAGVFSGIGNAVSQTHQTISQSALGSVATYDPKRIAEAGVAQGSSKALDKIADYYIARANETYPIIEIDANRIGEIIFTSGVDFGQDFVGNIKKEDDY